jgi:dihydropteroate synthase
MRFQARQFEFVFPRPSLLMGIVNVTPDSFSDGGRYLDATAAIEHGLRLVGEGADILDIGGESTRPNAELVGVEEELKRVLPVIRELAKSTDRPLSIDTQKPEVAAAAIEAGAAIVNDIAANREDPAMWRLVAQSGAGYVCMHMRGTPQTMQKSPHYRDVVAEVEAFFIDRMKRLEAVGVRREQVVLDPGIGFGKTLKHNLTLLGALSCFQKLERPLLLGVSRKSFIAKLTEAGPGDRLSGSLAATALAVRDGVQLIRAHDVAATWQALKITGAITEHASRRGLND